MPGTRQAVDETARRRERQLAWMVHVNQLWYLLPRPAKAVVWLIPMALAQAVVFPEHLLGLIHMMR